ncbi:IS110 family transposase [bacterium]|nr:IS110 family transposase [bacterium]
MTEQLKNIDGKIKEIIKEHYEDLNAFLTSIPGIGPKTAAVLILITEGFTKFETYKAVIAFAGLAPRTFESGKSVKGPSHICKIGAKHLRKLLYECAHSAKRFNPICKKLFDRLYHEKKKPFKVAMMAVANKLIKIAFALAISKTKFDPNYQSNWQPTK